MKLLFDENLSHKLVKLLADIFPDSIHVRDIGLKKADDSDIWEYAKSNHFTIVSKEFRYASAKLCIWLSPKNHLDKVGQLFHH